MAARIVAGGAPSPSRITCHAPQRRGAQHADGARGIDQQAARDAAVIRRDPLPAREQRPFQADVLAHHEIGRGDAVAPRAEPDDAAAPRRRGVDRRLDGGHIVGGAVADRAEVADVEHALGEDARGDLGEGRAACLRRRAAALHDGREIGGAERAGGRQV
jgi:hypothetical protein